MSDGPPQMDALTLQVIASEDRLAALATEWTDLHRRSARREPHVAHYWIMACWRQAARPSGTRLHIMTVRAGGRLVLALPMIARRNISGLTTLTALEAATPFYTELLMEESEAGEAALALCADRLRTDWRLWRLRFNRVREESDMARLMRLVGARRIRVSQAAIVALTTWPDFESFLAGLSQNLRGDYVRTRRELKAIGADQMHRATEPAEIGRILDWVLATKLEKLADDPSAQVLADPGTRAFLNEVAVAGQQDGSAALHYLAQGDRIIAAELLFESDAGLMLSKCAYDPAMRRFSVGTYIKFEILRAAMARGKADVDLMLGQYGWKERLQTGTVDVGSWRRHGFLLAQLLDRIAKPLAKQ